MTNFEFSYLLNNLYYDIGKRVNDSIVLQQLGFYNENNIVEMLHFTQFLEVLEKYNGYTKVRFNPLSDDEMTDILTGINIINNKNYELTF